MRAQVRRARPALDGFEPHPAGAAAYLLGGERYAQLLLLLRSWENSEHTLSIESSPLVDNLERDPLFLIGSAGAPLELKIEGKRINKKEA